MNTEWSDILSTIINHPGLTSAEIAEKMEIKGYYRTMKSTEAAEKVAKICNKLRDKSQVYSAKIKSPVTGQTVNAWSANPHRPIVEADPVEVVQDPVQVKTVTDSRPCCEPLQKKPELVEDVQKPTQSRSYVLRPLTFSITNGHYENEIELRGSTAVIASKTFLSFESIEQVDDFANAIKQVLSYAA